MVQYIIPFVIQKREKEGGGEIVETMKYKNRVKDAS